MAVTRPRVTHHCYIENEPDKGLQKPPGKSSRSGSTRCKIQPSISQTKEAYKNPSNPDKLDMSSVSGREDLPPSPWLPREVYTPQRANGKCLYGIGDRRNTFQYLKYSKLNYHDCHAPADGKGRNTDPDDTGSNRQITRQHSFDSQQAMNQYTSASILHGGGGLTKRSWEWRIWGRRHKS